MKTILKPRNLLIEKIAGQFAAVWFEAGMNTPGMDMLRKKYKNDPRLFAKHNIEKFIPKAIETLLDMLNRPDIAIEIKEEIYDELLERANEPSNDPLANVDIKKLLAITENSTHRVDKILNAGTAQALKPKREAPITIQNPFKATRQ